MALYDDGSDPTSSTSQLERQGRQDQSVTGVAISDNLSDSETSSVSGASEALAAAALQDMRNPSSASAIAASSTLGKRGYEANTGQEIAARRPEKRPCLTPIGTEREPDRASGPHTGLPGRSAGHVSPPHSAWDGSQAESAITTPWHDPFDLSSISPQAQGELWSQPAGDFGSLIAWDPNDWTLLGGEQMYSTTGYGQL